MIPLALFFRIDYKFMVLFIIPPRDDLFLSLEKRVDCWQKKKKKNSNRLC